MRELIREASDAGGKYSATTQEEEHQRSGLAAVQATALHASEGEMSTVRALAGPPTSTQQVGRCTGSPETLSLFRFLPDFAERDSAQFQA